jgi:CRP-like cAMP-binding protein
VSSKSSSGSTDLNKLVEHPSASSANASAAALDAHRGNSLLAALKPEELNFLGPHLQLVNLRLAEVLHEPGDFVEYAYFPHDSMISLVALLEDGLSAEVAVFGREGVMGFVSSLVTNLSFGRYIVQARGSASRIAVARLKQAVDARPDIRHLFLRYTEALLAQTFQTVACNAVHTVEARCCRWILTTRDRVGRDDIPLTHEFLAELLGVQRPTVSVVTRALQTAGLIKQGRSVISIVDPAGLEQTACGCYGTIRRSFERLLPGTFSRGHRMLT